MIIHYQLKRLSGDFMNKTFIKTIFRDFKRNFSRLISIIAIMALGSGFLIGLLSSTPVLQHSMDRFYHQQDMYDILLKSTLGFTQEEVDQLSKDVQDAEKVEGFSSLDNEINFAGQSITVRTTISNLKDGINQVELIAGEYPKTKHECLIQNLGYFFEKDCIGKTIEVGEDTYTIVGICNSPVYSYKMQEPSTVGKGTVDAFLYIDSAFTEYIITDVAFLLKDSKKYNSFDKSYFSYIEPYKEKLKGLENSYLEVRLKNLKESAFDEALEEARQQLLLQFPNLPIESIETILNSQKDKIFEEVEKQLADIKLKWYILDRKSNMSYVSYEENSNKVNRVAVIFPFFFFFIAALISLTSVTRLVYEDRASIGTLKSFGYSKRKILSKYLIYAIFACGIGTLGGLFLGVYGLPYVIYICYNSLFVMPACKLSWHIEYVLLASITMSITIFCVMIAVCFKALNEKPNALLMPKAPKAGKRILLERIGFIWKKLKFKYKSSIRNVFRFKSNLMMMIVGVGGCTGLMLIGLGLNDSINALGNEQYQNILKYDFMLTVDQEVEMEYLKDSSWMYLYQEEASLNKDSIYEIELLYTEDNIIDFMNLGIDAFMEDSVVISSQLAHDFHLRKNDTIELLVEGEVKQFKITNIFTNYVSNYVIVHQSLIKEPVNRLLLKLGEQDKANYEETIRHIFATEEFLTIEDLSQTRTIYASMTDSIGLVVLLIIFFSGLLAIVVIYNLTNININERIKEIATLRVLGYHRKEVLGYIYREIIIMSVLGIVFGFLLGPILNYFVMRQISSPGLRFNANLSGLYYLYSFLITLGFVIIVLLLFIPKIKKIKMVESLKSVE